MIVVDIETSSTADIEISTVEISKNTTINVGRGGKEYTGEYTVYPSTKDKILETQDCILTDDVTVKGIPTVEVQVDRSEQALLFPGSLVTLE